MKKFLNGILGQSPITTISAFVVAGFIAADALIQTGVTDWKQIVMAFVVALFGRFTKDVTTTGKEG